MTEEKIIRYSLLIINSSNLNDYWENVANGIRFDNLTKEEVEVLTSLSIKQDFSTIIRKYKKEE